MKRTMKIMVVPAFVSAGALLFVGCSSSNNLLLGRVEAQVGTHDVVVTDCYRTSVPPPQQEKTEDGRTIYRYVPCRDADIEIRAEELSVNGKRYGVLKPGDSVTVDHGKVLINGKVGVEQVLNQTR
jgi:hypothetical protein